MKKKFTWLGLSALIVAAMLLASCSTSTTASSTTSTTSMMTTTTTSASTGGATALTVTEGNNVKTYSMADLQALPSVSGNGGYMGKGGAITGPFSYQGVALTTLLNAVGGISEGETVNFTSSDNYTQSLTYDQITKDTLNYYDTSGNPINPSPKPTLTMIYSENGTLLDSTHGPTELGALSSQNILTDGSLWARMVISITITSSTTATMTTTATSTSSTTTTMSTTVTPMTTTTTAAVTTTTTPVATTPVILTVVNGNTSTTFSMTQLQLLQSIFGETSTINSKGTVSGPDNYIGVGLKTLLDAVGGFTSSNSVTVTGSDGYAKTLTYAMVETGAGVNVVDGTLSTVTPTTPAIPFLAYSKNGLAFDSATGPLDFGYITAAGQYTISNTWVKMATTITIIAAK